ncbi:unnamed protein product [Owenia fusiformis]|uniref:WSC domain-containing protein n=1 Tax=Owenia fusiformis TaxID=6347 RepID=A0A8S4PZJ0_OWEFU|nr:unnamed protein product [Owenia fusiformis]
MKRLTVFAAYFVVISSAHELCTREDAERLSYEIAELKENNQDTYIGCFIDVVRDRDLTNLQGFFPATHATPNTLDFCSKRCRILGFIYMGVQNGQDCWCSNTYGKHGEAPHSQCNVPCPGNRDTMCGAGQRNSIYKLVQTHNENYVGCFIDVGRDRDMTNFQGLFPATHATPNTLGFCSVKCRKLGFKYMGVQNGQDCWCSNTYGKHEDAEQMGSYTWECKMARIAGVATLMESMVRRITRAATFRALDIEMICVEDSIGILFTNLMADDTQREHLVTQDNRLVASRNNLDSHH